MPEVAVWNFKMERQELNEVVPCPTPPLAEQQEYPFPPPAPPAPPVTKLPPAPAPLPPFPPTPLPILMPPVDKYAKLINYEYYFYN